MSKKVYFGKYFGRDGIGNLLEHFSVLTLPKGQFFGIGERDE